MIVVIVVVFFVFRMWESQAGMWALGICVYTTCERHNDNDNRPNLVVRCAMAAYVQMCGSLRVGATLHNNAQFMRDLRGLVEEEEYGWTLP